MGRLIKQASAFLVLLVVVYVAAMAVMAHLPFQGKPLIFRTGDYYNWPGGDTWQRFREYDPEVRQDAVIIGSSHAYRGYDPFVFRDRGYKVFNLGSSAQTPLNTYPLIEHFLDSTNCPLLILDVYEGVFTNVGLESTADLTQNQPSDAAALDMAWAIRDLRGLNMMALRMLTRRDKPYYTSDYYEGLGFCAIPDSVNWEAPPPPDKGIELSSTQRHYFESCIRLCRERGIRLVVASHYARRNRKGPAHTVLTSYMDSILAGTGIPYLDYTNTPGVDELHWFADDSHLNTTGARIFTAQLVDSLENLGILNSEQVTLPPGAGGGADRARIAALARSLAAFRPRE